MTSSTLASTLRLALALALVFAWTAPVSAAKDAVAFLVDERTAGDLNGDGDTTDAVLHVVDTRTGSINLRLAASLVCRATLSPPFTQCEPVQPVVEGSVVAFLAGEGSQGADLNSDADLVDDVLFVYSGQTGHLTNTRLAVARAVGRDVSSYTFPVLPVVAGGAVALLVGESEQGSRDLNGDGDIQDDVLHLVEPKSFAAINIRLASATVPGPFGARNPIPLTREGQQVAFVSGEPEQGADLNGDGDAADQVGYLLNVHNSRLRQAK